MLTSSFEPLTGGAETYARVLCAGLTRRGHDVVVATDGSWLSDTTTDTAEDAGRVLRMSAFAGRIDARDRVKWRQMQYSVLDELGGLLDGARFDVIHANSHETLVLGSMIALEQDAALVATLHEMHPHTERFGLGRCRLSYEVLPVDLFLAPSAFYAGRVTDFGVPQESLRVIYHGVDPSPPPGDGDRLRQMLGIDASARLIVLPARVHPRKGQMELLRALPQVLARIPRAQVLFAGRISDFGYQRRLDQVVQQTGTADRVRLCEGLSARDMPDVYAAADVVVQPSWEEGLGLSAIEAMAARRPVVATRVTGLSEVIRDGHDGLLVPARDPRRLAAAVVKVLSDPREAERLAREAVASVRARFAEDRMVEATLEAYTDAVHRRATRAVGDWRESVR
ncbi:glycosyltransferase family 4 protein [Streptomyces tendae]|uniref:glycosyltransferase family 4 protein n=1 Tax=Streptomyces tendae TaxID=1932 RepID=UPI00364F20D5